MGLFTCSPRRRVLTSFLLFTSLSSCSAGAYWSSARHEAVQRRAASEPQDEPQVALIQSKSAAPILERNPFDSATGPLDQTDQTSLQREGPTCPNITLRRVVLSVSPEWSFAEIADGSRPLLLQLGSPFRGRHLASIEEDRIWMTGAEGACQVEIEDRPLTSSPACAALKFPAGPPCIVRRRDGSFDVTMNMMDHILEEQAELMRSARVVPETDGHGRVLGIRIFAIRAGSRLAALGFENGDTLLRFNGYDVTSPDHALEAYASLRRASEIRVRIRRRGAEAELLYHLR